MIKINQTKQVGWTPIPNSILNDKTLTLKAKALLTYLNSKPSNWNFAVWRIQQEMLEGEASIRSGLRELRGAGFLSYKPKFNEQGKPNGMRYIITKKKTCKGWTPVPKIILCDTNISLKAKGLWAYIHSKPESWEFATHRIQTQTKERKGSISKGLKELRENGYLRYEMRRGENGRANGSYYILNDVSNINKILPESQGLKTYNVENKGYIHGKDPRISKVQNYDIHSELELSNNHISKTQSISFKKNKKKFEYEGQAKMHTLDTNESKQSTQNMFEAKIESMIENSIFTQAKEKYFKEMDEEDTKFRLKMFYNSYPNAKLTSVIEYLTNMNLHNLKLLKARKRAEKSAKKRKNRENPSESDNDTDYSGRYSKKNYNNTGRGEASCRFTGNKYKDYYQKKESYSNGYKDTNLKPGIWHPSQIKFKDKIVDEKQEEAERAYLLARFEQQSALAMKYEKIRKEEAEKRQNKSAKFNVKSEYVARPSSESLYHARQWKNRANSTCGMSKLGSIFAKNPTFSKYMTNRQE